MGRYVDLSEKVTATYYDEQYEEWDHHTVTIEDVLNEVCDDYTILPTIESRKKGKWNHGLCSVCGYDWGKDAPIANVPPFCPNCGAQMER